MARARAAVAIGVSEKTLTRAESGHVPKGDFLIRAARVYGRSLSELDNLVGQDVPRGTPAFREATPIPYGIGARFEAFARELIRAGATDEEVDFVTDTLKRPETARLVHPSPDGAADDQWDELLDDLRAFIARRIERRAPPPAQPIRPKDVPALVAKRHAEVFGEPAKKKRAT